ncbi:MULTISPECIES: YwqH-like family protein [Shouchella]|uniref:Uncharacterized protein n=3 Tax=Shouchella TaxID=2893057 RepID=Q5WBP7_SHOC1|nr:DUF5082 family protein [Shouchella clausii]MCM3378779.1 DUF5082 domain-containing protein [Shouchella rhizosphaerae]MCZ1182590.1 DUF5082 domain-containing protein [Shouchella clausii]MDO7266681.1 DUF5082 family protein [Shouchella clausii]MDO7283895.1 DUF5082 family protein [Shouchella clausii]MDO7286404.1 DUF5082 family protein [Shouchella clausii]
MHERIVRLKSRNNELRARVGEAQGNIERLETARTTISEEKPNVQDNRETLTRKALDGDEWRGNRKEEHEGLRDDIKAKFDEAESHIEQLLEDMKAKKAQLQSSIETMQNTMMLNELLIREEREKARG